MTISIHQPNYLPYLGLFYKISKSDIFCFLDDAQFSNEGMHDYNYVKTPQGKFKLKIPVEQHLGDKICEVRTKDELNWKEKHLKTIEMCYGKADYFELIYPELERIVNAKYRSIADMNEEIIMWICGAFNFKTKFVFSKELNLRSKKEQKVIDIIKYYQCTEYYSGNGATVYQQNDDFKNQGITLRYSDYVPKKYPQMYGKFIPNLSIIDYVMNCGFDWRKVVENVE